jgi:WD40 repeat protein
LGPQRGRLAWASRLVAAGATGTSIQIWDARNKKMLDGPSAPPGDVEAIAFSADGRRLAVLQREQGVTVWDTLEGAVPASLTSDDDPIEAIAWAPAGAHLAVGNNSGSIRIWDVSVAEKTIVERIECSEAVTSLAWHPDGKRIAAIVGRQPTVWDTRTRQEILGLSLGRHTHFRAIRFSPDGTMLAAGGAELEAGMRGLIVLVNLSGPQRGETAFLRGHHQPVSALAYSPDGKRLASAGEDNTLRIWDVEPDKDGANSQDVSQDLGRERLVIRGPGLLIRAAEWDRHGMQLASADENGEVRLWDAGTGHALAGSALILDELDELIDRGTANADELRRRGLLHARRREWEQAGADFEESLEVSSDKGPRPHWFMTAWWVNGPFPATGGERVATSGPDEQFLRDTLAAASSQRAERSGAENTLIEMIASPASWEGIVALIAGSSGELDVTSVVQKLSNQLDRIDLFTAALKTDPDHAALLAARGECYAGQGDWALAASDYVKAAGLDPDDSMKWMFAGALLVKAGDLEGYHAHCLRMIAKFCDTESAGDAERTAKICLFVEPLAAALGEASRLAELSAELAASRDELRWLAPYAACVCGMAAYRSGDFEGAARFCQECIKHGTARDVWFRTAQAQFVLAMSQARLGRADKAAQSLADGKAAFFGKAPTFDLSALGGNWHDWLICEALSHEAAARLSVAAAGDAKSPSTTPPERESQPGRSP